VNYSVVCHVEADISNYTHSLARKMYNGVVYYQIEFDIAFFFGLTELKAQIVWKENVSQVNFSRKKPFIS
jgi:hypothetical protein